MAKKEKKVLVKKNIPSNLALNEYEKVLTRKEYIDIGNVKIENNYETSAGQRFEAAKTWIPRILFFCKICAGLSILSFILLFLTFLRQPSPTLLANYSTGTLACTISPIDSSTKKALPREEKKYENICNSLANFNNEYGD